MKNTKNFFAHMNIVCVVIMAVALVCAVIAESFGMRVVVCGAAVVLVGGLYAVRGFMLRGDFAGMAMAQLRKRGLSCSRVDDGFLVKRGEFTVKAKLWGNDARGLKRVHFMFNFAPQKLDSVLPEGWAVLAAECNANYDYTTVKFYGDHFCCMVETSVKSTKDFLNEYRFAIDKINETLKGMEANAKRVAEQFPARRRAGFVI